MSEDDKRTDVDEQQVKETPSLLHMPRIAVSRINRKIVMALLLIFGSLAALSLIWAVSPGKTAGDRPAKQEDTARQTPTLPENVVDSPSSYRELAKGERRGIQPQQSEYDAGRALSAAGDGRPAYVAYPASQGQPTPAQAAAHEAAEQRRKDLNDALRAPLVFGGQAMAAQPAAHMAEPLPYVPGREMDSMTRRLSAILPGGDDDQNMQEEKRSFANDTRSQSPYLLASLQQPLSRYEVKAGTIIPSLLITGLNSDLPGQLTAQVRENVYDTATGRYLLIPQGTRLVGDYDSKVAYGQERALIVWSRLIMPNGNSINLEGMPGVDMSGYAGLSDKVNNHYVKLLTGVILGSVIGAGAQVATGGQGTAFNAPSFGQLAVAGAAQNINQAGQQITQRNLNLQPTIEIRPGLKLNVFVTKDIILKPYRD